jgi:membrane protease YdiL (CAAX protease family)
MEKRKFLLIEHPWLFLLVFILATLICFSAAGAILATLFKMPGDSAATGTWIMLLGNSLLLFIVVPFIFGFPKKAHPYETYLSEIRLSHMRPLLKLILLGISCYLILAPCQVAGVLVYRLNHGFPITLSFIRYTFVPTNDLPPNSLSWFYSLPSIFEEIAFRGVILVMFLRYYNHPKAVLFSALGFGLIHLNNLLDGADPVWVAGQVVWATIIGMFYAYVTIKSDSLLPAMIVHYLGNLFVSSLNSYIEGNASVTIQVIFGIVFTFGIVPVILMSGWVKGYTNWMKIPSSKSNGFEDTIPAI